MEELITSLNSTQEQGKLQDPQIPTDEKTSNVKDYFLLDTDQNTYTCLLCKKLNKITNIKNCNNTSNLRKHIQTNHSREFKIITEADEKKKNNKDLLTKIEKSNNQLSIMDCYNKTDLKIDTIKFEEILSEFIYKNMLPYDIMDNVSTKKLFEYINPNIKLPSRNTLSRRIIPTQYNKKREELLQKIKSNISDSVCISFDSWTGYNNHSYLSININIISPNNKIENYILDTVDISSDHTAEGISGEVKDVLFDYGIHEKDFFCTTDSGPNMVLASKLLNAKNIHCFAHLIHNAISNGLNNHYVNEVLDNLRKLVKVMRRSKISSLFENYISKKNSELLNNLTQEQQFKRPLKFKLDVKTRWNSIYTMKDT